MLANGAGGLDWAGLPLAVAHYGITNLPAVIDRLVVVKTHRPPEHAANQPPALGAGT